MPKPSKFKTAKGNSSNQPKRPAAAIETIADVISVARSDYDDVSRSKEKSSKRAKTSHTPIGSDDENAPKFAVQPRATKPQGNSTAKLPSKKTATGTATTATTSSTSNAQSTSSTIVVPDTEPPNAYTVLSPHLSDTLRSTYDIHPLSIISSTKITTRVTTLLELLENGFDLGKQAQKPGIVALTAKAPAANKLVSVVEIAKRELESKKVRWFQYSGVGGWMGKYISKDERKSQKSWGPGKKLNATKDEDKTQKEAGDMDIEGTSAEPVPIDDDDEDEEEAFETMGASKGEQPRKKVREVPVLTIYMSRVPIAALKAEYGEQSHDPRKPLGAS